MVAWRDKQNSKLSDGRTHLEQIIDDKSMHTGKKTVSTAEEESKVGVC
jgi:hypothetical protein